MKQVLSALFLILVLDSTAQKKSGYASISLAGYFSGNQAFGGHVSGNAEMGKDAYIGLEIGGLKFEELPGIYFPLQARFTLWPETGKPVRPMVILSPGYGVYKKAIGTNGVYVETTGGFTFYGGAGATFSGKGKGSGYVSLGYSLFQFTTENLKSNLKTFGIRAGMIIK